MSVFLLAVNLLANQLSETLERNLGVQLKYRVDGGVFKLQRLKSKRKIKLMTVQSMQYANGAVFVKGCAMELQEEVSVTDAQL